MEGNISDPNPALASLDDTSAALTAVKNLVRDGRSAATLRSMFSVFGADEKPVAAVKADQSLQRLRPKATLPAPRL
jgi:hypothetical protein